MHKSIISILLFFSISFSGVIFGTGLALANTTDQRATSEADLIANYHITANQIVNEQISALLNFFNDFDVNTPDYADAILEAFSPPQFLSSEGVVLPLNEVCDGNLSSACLNRKLTVELRLLYSSLAGQAEGVSTDSIFSLNDISSILQGSDDINVFVRDQLEVAVRITRQVVEFYSQILQAYPMHVQNQKIIEELKVLQSNLFSLRNSMQPYSNIFHNVTSAACE